MGTYIATSAALAYLAYELGHLRARREQRRILAAYSAHLELMHETCALEYENGVRHGRSALWTDLTAALNAHDQEALLAVHYLHRKGKVVV